MKSCFSQVRGYLDFDVEMENVGVFWSGTEALLLEYRWKTSSVLILLTLSQSSQEQQRLREKQKMLKNDWERFKQQRKEIESSLMEKPQAGGGGWVHSHFSTISFLAIFLTICNLPNLTFDCQGGPCHPWRVPAPASHWA